jgi:hypothetical protein
VQVQEIELDDIDVVYAPAAGSPESIPTAAATAFARLEAAAVPRGRKMLGYWSPHELQYRACYARQDGDDPRAMGLLTGTVPGGRYRRLRLKADDVFARIPAGFDLLASAGPVADDGRPWLEIYRRHNELDLLVPVAEPTVR